MNAATATWIIAALATIGVVIRPWRVPEAVWAMTGALLLVAFGLLSWRDALAGVASGIDVYLFLTGMMLLAEIARQEGLFDWLAAKAIGLARGSAPRLFTLIYGVGTLVTIFLSNDATAVVLTPAVGAVVATAGAKQPLPYLLTCAFIANAASFVLPISNPANLVVYGASMPPLLRWLPLYALPSALSIAATYAVLRLTQRVPLRQEISTVIATPSLSVGGKLTACGIGVTSIALLAASAFDVRLGLPTFLAGTVTALIVFACSTNSAAQTLKHVSWGVLPLVAGFFVLVGGLEKTGAAAALSTLLRDLTQYSAALAAWASGAAIAFASNLVNNLPAGLIAGRVIEGTSAPEHVQAAVLIGVDLGPNLSVTGSLATILWLSALRSDGHHVDAWTFLKLGALVMPPALVLALAGLFAVG